MATVPFSRPAALQPPPKAPSRRRSTQPRHPLLMQLHQRPQPQHLKLPQQLRLHRRLPRSPTSLTPSPQPRRLAQKAQTQRSPTTRPTTASTSPSLAEIPVRPARLEPQEQRPSLSALSQLPVHLRLCEQRHERAATFDFAIPRAMLERLERPGPQRSL